MKIIIGGIVIPKPSTFKRIIDPNETDRRTLAGNLYTDFINNTRSWVIGWKLMTREDYQIIYNLYLAQYQRSIYHILQFNAYSLYVPIKMNITEQNIKWNGALIEDFSMILKEQLPFS